MKINHSCKATRHTVGQSAKKTFKRFVIISSIPKNIAGELIKFLLFLRTVFLYLAIFIGLLGKLKYFWGAWDWVGAMFDVFIRCLSMFQLAFSPLVEQLRLLPHTNSF